LDSAALGATATLVGLVAGAEGRVEAVMPVGFFAAGVAVVADATAAAGSTERDARNRCFFSTGAAFFIICARRCAVVSFFCGFIAFFFSSSVGFLFLALSRGPAFLSPLSGSDGGGGWGGAAVAVVAAFFLERTSGFAAD
jgi:hypothetical protein